MTTGSHYTVLARRFRPQAFGDVVGQEHVARALQNAIRAGRVAHAYLFTGARGVGKTSTARILAKALNCPHVVDGVPCNQCDICEGISAGNDVDVLEIDGASNRGIDDIRSLRANVGVRSMRTQYKVYIIDEVHMLTREAFNALLKTLEEPPPNVKFVFCTTEPNKVPDTILSRCQRFDFSAIGESSIAQRLAEIATAEGFVVSEDALELVARRARGSMRDSQSLFDQLLAFSDGTVTGEDVHRMLGTAGDDRLVELFAAVSEHRPGEVLRLLDDSLESGVQAGELMEQSIAYVRDLMVVQCGGVTVQLSSVSNSCRTSLTTHAQQMGIHSIMAAFQILADARNQMFRATFGRTILEMAMVQLSLLENLSAISDLLSGRLPTLPELPMPVHPGNSVSVSSEPKHSLTEPEKKKPDNLKPDQASCTENELSRLPGEQSEPVTATDVHTDSTITHEHSVPHDELSHDEEGAGESEPMPVAVSVPVEIEWTEGNAVQLQKQLISRLPMTVSAALRQSTAFQVHVDQRLEISVGESYEFARKTLGEPENRHLIQSELLRLTGRDIEVSVKVMPRPTGAEPIQRGVRAEKISASGTSTSNVDAAAFSRDPDNAASGDSTAESQRSASNPGLVRHPQRTGTIAATGSDQQTGPRSASPPVNLLQEVDPQQDPFVRHVLEVFGATVVRVMPAPGARLAGGDESGSGDAG